MLPEASATPFTDSQSARPKLTLVDPTERPAFAGFTKPNTTPVPDEFFDVLAPTLTDGELRVALYIIRRTYGFKKQEDAISLGQMVNGIRGRDGAMLDHGTGLSKASVIRALKGLEARGVIHSERQRDAVKGNRPTIYRLRLGEEGVSWADRYEQLLATRIIDPSGWIYLLHGKDVGYCKIGRTNDLTERLRDLDIQLPFKINLLHTIRCDNMANGERYLHRKYRDQRVNGEWFLLQEADIAWIRGLEPVFPWEVQ